MCFLACFCECFISLRVREWWFVVRARRSSYLNSLTSIETLFAFFCALRFFNLSIVTYPSVLRWKTRASCGRKALKKLEALFKTLEKEFLFSFFVPLCSLVRADGGCVCPRVFRSLSLSLSRLSLNFSSLSKASSRTFPTQNHHFLQKRCLFSP